MELRDRRICVTGSSGFLGYHLTEELIGNGAEVVALDKVPNPMLTKKYKGSKSYAFVLSDIEKIESAKESLEESNVIVHLAGIAVPRLCNSDPELAFRINVEAMKEVLKYSTKADRFVFASTGMVYGDQTDIPIRETAPTNARDVYALTKLIGENLCQIFHHRYGLPYTLLRFANSYGPYQAPDYLVPSLIGQGSKDGRIEVWDSKPIRDFIFVKDTVAAIISILKTDVTENEVLNVGTGRGISTKEIAGIMSKILNVPWVEVNKKFNVTPKIVLDISKVKSLTGWSPVVSLEEGLTITVNHYLANSGTPISLKLGGKSSE